MDVTTLRTEPTVERWLSSSGIADEDDREIDGHLELLAQFCDHTGMGPGELIEKCLRPLDSGDAEQREISLKGRGEINTAIDDWSDGLSGTSFMRIIAGNTVRGFLVHNGILIQGRPAL